MRWPDEFMTALEDRLRTDFATKLPENMAALVLVLQRAAKVANKVMSFSRVSYRLLW